MNSFQSIESGQGLLKPQYDDDSPVARALKKRADRLKDKINTPTKDDLEMNETED